MAQPWYYVISHKCQPESSLNVFFSSNLLSKRDVDKSVENHMSPVYRSLSHIFLMKPLKNQIIWAFILVT